jgi:hypothetical protein
MYETPQAPLCWPWTTDRPISRFSFLTLRDAARLLRECVSCLPKLQFPHVMLAYAYSQSGQLEEARREAAEVLRINPGFTIESWKSLEAFKYPKDIEHRLDGLRKAGLPES